MNCDTLPLGKLIIIYIIFNLLNVVAQNSCKVYQSKLSYLCLLVVRGQMQLRTSVTKPINIDPNHSHKSAAFLHGTLRLINWQLSSMHRAELASYCQLPITIKEIVRHVRRRDLLTFQVNFIPT